MAIKINVKNTFIYFTLLLCIILLGTVVFYILKCANKGFELSDETFYLHFSSNFNSDVYTVTNFGLLNKFVCFGDPSLVNLRLAKFFYQSFAVLIFVLSLLRFLNFKGYTLTTIQKTFILVITLMVSYCNYDYLPMTLSYNTWSLVIMLLCFSLVFLEYTTVKISSAFITSACYGFLCFGFFLTKFPNAVIALLIYFVFNLFSIKRNFWFKIPGLIIGALIAYFALLNNFNDLKNIIDNYYITLFEAKHVKVNSYFSQVYEFFIFCCDQHWVLIELTVFLVAVVIRGYLKKYKTPVSFLLLVINYSLSVFFFKGNSAVLHNDFVAAAIFIITALLFIYLFSDPSEKWLPKKEIFLITAFLFITPFFLMLGTDNMFYYTSSQTMVFSIIAIIIFIISKNKLNENFLALKCLVMCLFIVSILYRGGLTKPYRQDNLLLKTYPLHFTRQVDGVFESYGRFADFVTMNFLINKFNANKKPIVTFFTDFGLGYINNCKVFPDSPISDGSHTIWYNEFILNRYKFDDRFDLLVIPNNVEHDPNFKTLLSKYDVRLGENYRLVYVYKYNSINENIYLYKKQI
jgi:hypothetical protein